ncbi:iron-containing alcohol dehydrogenase [Falsiroseomonas ponticola]|uniref:iron-containing alcohol dehydrogenase n=1 Tax=Falsiroseomonas ponticola TaxID=2786951 RepID=UPI00193481C5|nr:iron-containing alcohol dehydrogenase [Roseomonas ponticola]
MTDLLRPIEILRPTRLEFGAGTVGIVGQWAREQGITRTLVISGGFNAKRVAVLGLPGEVAIFGQVKPEPDLPNLQAALAMAEAFQPQLVVGFGGGSALDLAKLVAVLPGSGQTLHEVVGPEKVKGRSVKLAQVPTTAGTGSEAGTRSLVTDPATEQKLAVQSRHMLADLAVVDAELTMSVPPAVTAATGVDAMAHCVEAFTSKRAHPLIDLYALEGIRLVGRYLARAVADGSDTEARAGLMLASLYGGYCLGPVNTTAGHAVAYPLGTRQHIAHGHACALVFPHTLAFNAPVMAEKTALVLQALGLPASSDEGVVRDATHAFCAKLGIEMRLSALGVPEASLEAMANEAHAIRRLLDNNPRDISAAEILAIYRRAF